MEHRHFPRSLSKATVYLQKPDGSGQYRGRVLDICAHGMRVQLENRAPALKSMLVLLLPSAGATGQKSLRLPMLVVHRSGNQVGLDLLDDDCRFSVNGDTVETIYCRTSDQTAVAH